MASSKKSPKGALLKTILVVEDHPTNLKMAVEMLEMDGWQVRTAGTGGEALEFLKTSAPSIVLVDIGLPDMDGFAVLDHIRNNKTLQAVKVVSFTGMGITHYREKVMSHSFDGYIDKPIDLIQFLKTLNELLT